MVSQTPQGMRSPITSFRPVDSTIYWIREGQMPLLGIAVGNFVDPTFPTPTMEVHIEMRHGWVAPVVGAEQLGNVHGT